MSNSSNTDSATAYGGPANYCLVSDLRNLRKYVAPPSTRLADPSLRKQRKSDTPSWTRDNLQFPADAPIVVKEVPCVKPGCPPIETAIIVFLKGEPPRLFKIQRTITDVTFDDVYNLIENPLPCC